MACKIAYIKYRSNSYTNQKVSEVLKRSFSGCEVETIDVLALLLKKMPHVVFLNVFLTLKTYGFSLLWHWREFERRFLATPYIFRKIKSFLSTYLSQQQFKISFQIQSMFDASSGQIPHFVYTDHTHLANLRYAGFNKKRLHVKEWIDLEKSIYQQATLNFTMSSHISHSIIDQYGVTPDKVVCVYGGSNVKADGFNASAKSYDKRNILFVGVDWERKGGPELAEAFKKVLQVYPESRLTIVGASPELHIKNCEIIGRVPLSEVSKFYKNASLFCLPTKVEPFGIAFIEAMSYGLPIIATRIGGVPDFVFPGKNGLLVDSGDVEALSLALMDLLKDANKRKDYGHASLEIVQDRYSWEKVGQRLKEHIERYL